MTAHPIDQWLDAADQAVRPDNPHGHCTLHGLPEPCMHCNPPIRLPRPKPAP